MGSPYCRQVDSSCMFIMKLPSPVTQATTASGWANCTPMAAGSPNPMVPRPPELIQRRGAVELVVLRGEHLVLADVAGHEGVPPGDPVERLHGQLRENRLARLGHEVMLETVGLAPATDLLPPTGQGFGVRQGPRLTHFRLEDGLQVVQHARHLTDDADVGRDDLRDGRRIDVDVNDGGVGTELARMVGDAVVEAGAHGEDHVGLMHGHVGLIGAVHAEHAEELLVVAGKGAEAHQRVGDREIRAAGRCG
jgi:hypothetical protein